MSGYVIAFVQDEQLRNFTNLFLERETTTYPLIDGYTMVFVSADGQTIGSNFFRGFAIDHENQSCVFPGAAISDLPIPMMPLDGSYIVSRNMGHSTQVGADVYGFTSMAWFHSPGLAVISDSYLALLHVRKTLGLSVTPDLDVIRSRMWDNALANQQLSQSTYCAEIKYSTPGSFLEFNHISKELTETVKNLFQFYIPDHSTHAELVRESAFRMVQSFRCYAAAGGLVTLGLSGGIDSRAVLAGALAAGIDEALHVVSSPKALTDYPVALQLAEQFSFELNGKDPQILGNLKKNDSLALWAASSMGLYDSPYANPSFRQHDVPVFIAGGHGAGAAKGGYGWRAIQDINMPPVTMEEVSAGIRAIGASETDKWGSEWHFLAYRNAIHGGRGAQQTDYLARPVIQTPLVKLSRSVENQLPSPKRGRSVILDVLIALNPRLALMHYESVRKNIDKDYLDRRLEEVGGPISSYELQSLPAYRILGKPQPSEGFSKSLIEIAVSNQLSGNLTPSDFLETYHLRSPLEKEMIGELGVQAIKMLKTQKESGKWINSSWKARAGKILTVQLVV